MNQLETRKTYLSMKGPVVQIWEHGGCHKGMMDRELRRVGKKLYAWVVGMWCGVTRVSIW
jgi:hypothetical protein